MMTKISVSIVNVTSYTGLELLRLLAQHPHFSVRSATARSAVGKRLGEVFPQLRLQPTGRDIGRAGVNPELVLSEEPAQTDLAFVCLPHAAAAESIVTLLERGIKVVDSPPIFVCAMLPSMKSGTSIPIPRLLCSPPYPSPSCRSAGRGSCSRYWRSAR